VKVKDIDPTILRDIGAYEDYPFEALHRTALVLLIELDWPNYSYYCDRFVLGWPK